MDPLFVVAKIVLALIALWVVGASLFMWFTTWREAQARWCSLIVGTESILRGPLRDAATPGPRLDGPPMSVRLAALGSWILGSLFFPGVPLCVGGLFLMGMGVFVIPALFLAWRSFFLGRSLLMGEASSVRRARTLALFTVLINGATLAVVVWWVVVSMPGFHRGLAYPTPISALSFFGPALVVVVHVVASLLHAALLVRAARAIEALHAGDTAAVRGETTGLPTDRAEHR